MQRVSPQAYHLSPSLAKQDALVQEAAHPEQPENDFPEAIVAQEEPRQNTAEENKREENTNENTNEQPAENGSATNK